MFELYDRSTRNSIGFFETREAAIDFIGRHIRPDRVRSLILGREDQLSGDYDKLLDGAALETEVRALRRPFQMFVTSGGARQDVPTHTRAFGVLRVFKVEHHAPRKVELALEKARGTFSLLGGAYSVLLDEPDASSQPGAISFGDSLTGHQPLWTMETGKLANDDRRGLIRQ
jgi:hypothetical protein